MTNVTCIKTCNIFVNSIAHREICPFFHYSLKYKHPTLTLLLLGFCVSAHPLALSKWDTAFSRLPGCQALSSPWASVVWVRVAKHQKKEKIMWVVDSQLGPVAVVKRKRFRVSWGHFSHTSPLFLCTFMVHKNRKLNITSFSKLNL